MTDNEIIGKAADALTEKAKFSITIPITVFPELPEPEPIPVIPVPLPQRTFWDWITRKPLPMPEPIQEPEPLPEVETERELVFYPCKVANMSRIARTALLLPDEFKSKNLSESVLPLMADETHINNIIYIIAAAVQNNHLEPDPELIQFLKLNLDHEDMFLCMHGALGNSGMESFFNTTVLARGTVQFLKPEKTSPIDGSELIASHTAQ